MRIQTGTYPWGQALARWLSRPVNRRIFWGIISFFGGFCLSAASLGNGIQPLCPAVLWVGLPGFLPLTYALGASLGYWVFWQMAGVQGLVWIAVSLGMGVLMSRKVKELPLLLPALGALTVAACGLVFRLWLGQSMNPGIYLVQIFLAFGAILLVQTLHRRTDPVLIALAVGAGTLALAQIAPVSTLNLGLVFGAGVAMLLSFPAAAMAGLALDLAGIVSVPMTAVLCLAFLVGKIPRLPKRLRIFLPVSCYLGVMALCGQWALAPVWSLIFGGFGALLPLEEPLARHQDPQSFLRSRLESLSAVLAQTGQMLRDVPSSPVDEGALMIRAAEQACTQCLYRQDCPAASQVAYLPQTMLHQRSITVEDMPPMCMNKERLQAQLQRSQDHYRLLLADRQRQKEYRGAVMQQYSFLADHLLTLADELPRRQEVIPAKFRPEVAVCSRGKRQTNGDRCLRFTAPGNQYYVLLCDGMGTGEAAAYEARIAAGQLRRMLCAGYPPLAALSTINSLCALRSAAGAVTVDLAKADLMTGRVTVYKLGAAPSWRLDREQWEQVGRECPPPGVSLEETEVTSDRIILGNGAALVMFSDGVDAQAALTGLEGQHDQPVGFLAALLLEMGVADVPDDATAVVLRLHPLG